MIGHLHQAPRLAVAFRLGHTEIVAQAGFGIAPFLGADHHHRLAAQSSQPADDRLVVAERPITRQRRKVGDQGRDIIRGLRSFGVTRHQGLLPGGQFAIAAGQLAVQLDLQPVDLFGDVDTVRVAQMAQGLDLAFQFGDRFFKFEKMHGCGF